MKISLAKIIIIPLLFLVMQIFACTNTPWHRQQAEMFLNKGISFIEMRQFNNAAKELLEAEKYSPYDHKIHYFLGMAYHGKGMRDKAIEEFKKAISLKEDYSEAHNYLGTLYSDMELWDQAIEEFDRALANPIYDTPAMALYNAGWAYYSKKDYKTALIKYQEALLREPLTNLRPQIEKNIGLVHYSQNNISEAIERFKKSVELNPSLYDAHFLLGECYLRIRDTEKARKAFQTVIKLSPQSSFGQKSNSYLQSLK
jgi:tetratricopeptide (TPR) repeat protein